MEFEDKLEKRFPTRVFLFLLFFSLKKSKNLSTAFRFMKRRSLFLW
jgi:hypothetical protein